MYNGIKFAINERKAERKVMPKRSDFEARPFDVNIVKMQMSLLKRLEKEMPENGDFAPVTETYENTDPTLDISTVKTVCKHVKDSAPKADTREIEISVLNRAKTKETKISVAKGTKENLLSYLDTSEFLTACKKHVKL